MAVVHERTSMVGLEKLKVTLLQLNERLLKVKLSDMCLTSGTNYPLFFFF